MNNFKKIINKKVIKLNKIDLIIFIFLILFFSIFSFQKLGNIKSPNTFYRFKNKDIIIDLKNQYHINKINIFNGEKTSNYNLYLSENNINYELISNYKTTGAFSWDSIELNYKDARYIKLEYYDKTSIGEIGVYSNNKLISDTYITNKEKMIQELNDEQQFVPIKRSYMNSTYFDEVYFARTAYEYVNNLEIYEWTHPPLGKIIQAIPIYITNNMSPFNYRFMGCLSGILLIGIMYIFGVKLFKKRKYGIYTALIMFLDTFRFAHTRMGTIDSHLVLFITLSILFMYIFTNNSKIKYLLLSGIFFGLSISIKWTGMYSGIALALIYFRYLIKNKKIKLKYIIYGTTFFVITPLLIYTSVFLVFNNNYYKTNNINNIIKINKKMYNYHSKLKDTHFFSSKWYTWPISYKPVWYHQVNTRNNYQETISGVGNIVIWYASIIGFIYVITKLIIKRDEESLFLVICSLSMWIPYIFIGRIMYLYHFFPVLPFFFMTSIALFKDLEEYNLKKVFTIYLLLSIIFFILYYPIVSGQEIEKNYTKSLQIYNSWYF